MMPGDLVQAFLWDEDYVLYEDPDKPWMLAKTEIPIPDKAVMLVVQRRKNRYDEWMCLVVRDGRLGWIEEACTKKA